MKRALRLTIKRRMPPALVNAVLLRFPSLYGTNMVYYESNLQENGGIDDLIDQLRQVKGIPGNVVECGSSRCGTSIIMARYLQDSGIDKRVLACDSFEGFDKAELAKERSASLTTADPGAFTSTSFKYVQQKVNALRMNELVLPVKGFFKDTLQGLVGPFCLALIDCDLRDSLIYASEMLWPMLSRDGRIVFDDYRHDGFAGARLGIDTFVRRHQSEIADHGLLRRLYFVRKM